MTTGQQQFYTFIKEFIEANGSFPSIRGFGVQDDV